MGADMTLFVLWAEKGVVDHAKALELVSAAIQAESDGDILDLAAKFVGVPLEPLAREVVRVEPATGSAWRDAIVAGYATAITNFKTSLRHRDVTQIFVGDMIGYSTGGVSWGDAPTETYSEWSQFFQENSDDEYDEYDDLIVNPYSDLIHDAMFIPRGRIRTSIAEPTGPGAQP